MVKKAKELVKGIVKNAAPKSTYATDPNDPWSAKAGIAENVTSRRADLLSKFYKAKGYNIKYVSKNQRVGQAKTGEFDKWKTDHGIYEQDEIGEGITYTPSSGNSKTGAGHTIVGTTWHPNGTKHANIVKHGVTGKYFAAGGSSSHPTKTTTFHDSPEEAAKGKKSLNKEEIVTEMDKNQTPPGRDGYVSHATYGSRDKKDPDAGKKQYIAKVITPKEASKKAGEILNKAFNKEEVVAEGFSDVVKGIKRKVAGKEDPKDVEHTYARIARSAIKHKTPDQAEKDIKRWEKVNKVVNKKGVAEETAPIDVKQIRSHTSDSPTHKRMHQLNRAAQIGTLGTVHSPLAAGLRKEDNINDPQCACQSPFDGANTTNDVAPKKSKAGKMVKEIYAKHRLKEDLYDHEKDDKGPGTFGKTPKVIKKVEVNDDNEKGTNARMVLKGGTTLTGEKRDTIEIDPMLKNRSKTADYLDQDPKKEQLRTK